MTVEYQSTLAAIALLLS